MSKLDEIKAEAEKLKHEIHKARARLNEKITVRKIDIIYR
jgi:translation elongation factor EF-Ts